jgi:methionyl aminopeptidase
MTLKSKAEIDIMRTNNKILAELLARLKEIIEPGITTLDIDKIADEFITGNGGYPGFKGFQGFPNSICASVNEQVIHGIPNGKPLNEGDIVSIDVGIKKDGFWGDTAYTFRVGKISPEKDKLCKITEESLYLGIKQAVTGNRIYDISNAIQSHVEENGFSVVREYTGHEIGREMHEQTKVPNYGRKGFGPRIKTGLCIAIEPMVNIGTHKIKILKDRWTVVTADNKPSAHYEHTIAVTENGPEILSRI